MSNLTSLYVANPTRQTRIFHYYDQVERLPNGAKRFIGAAKSVPIPPGEQRAVSKMMERGRAIEIMQENAMYGAAPASAAHNLTNQSIPLLFQIELPMRGQIIRDVYIRNESIAKDQGERTRREAAESIINTIRTSAEQSGRRIKQDSIVLEAERVDEKADEAPFHEQFNTSDNGRVQPLETQSHIAEAKRRRGRK